MFRVDRAHSVLPVPNRRIVRALGPARMHRRLPPKKKEIIARSRGLFVRTTTVPPARSARVPRVPHRIALPETAHVRPRHDHLQDVRLRDRPLAGLSLLVRLQQDAPPQPDPLVQGPKVLFLPFVNAAQKVCASTHALNPVRHGRIGKLPSGPR